MELRELRYCEKHHQMTNQRKIVLPLVIIFECLKCEKENEK